MTDTVKARRPAKKPDGAPSAPHAPAPHDTAPDAASPAWAQASVAAPFALGVPVQRKPVIGRAGDAYEREADAVADRVAGRNVVSAPLPISRVSAAALAPPVQPKSIGDRTEHDDPPQPNASGPGIIQRTPTVVQRAEDDEKPEMDPGAVQTKPAVSAVIQRAQDDEKPGDDSGAVQTKPAAPTVVPRAEDDEKPDADSGAVQTKPAASAVVQRAEDDEKPDEDSGAVQTKPAASAVIQRAEDDEKPDEDSGAVQAKGEPGGVAGGSPAMRTAAATAISTRGPGSPLPTPTRTTLEAGIGVDLRDVRVHTGPRAEDATSKLRARAFTHGRDIWLGRGESPADTRLMAHEATHVVQQDGVVRRAPAAPADAVARDEDEEERRREALAAAARESGAQDAALAAAAGAPGAAGAESAPSASASPAPAASAISALTTAKREDELPAEAATRPGAPRGPSRPTPPARRFPAPPARAEAPRTGAPAPASAPRPAALPPATDTMRGAGAPFALAGTRPAPPPAPSAPPARAARDAAAGAPAAADQTSATPTTAAPAASTGATSAAPAAAVTTTPVAATAPAAPDTAGPVAAGSGAAAPGAPASDAAAAPVEAAATGRAEETETGSAASAGTAAATGTAAPADTAAAEDTAAPGGAAVSADVPAQSAASAPTTAGPSPAAPAAGTTPAEPGAATPAAGAAPSAEGATAAAPAAAEAGEGAAAAGAGTAAAAEVVIPPAPRAEDDPQVQAVNRRMRGVARGQAAHPPAAAAAAQAQAAAEPPANERASQAAALQVNDLSQASTARPDPNPFLTLLRRRLAEIAPRNLDEMDRFQASGRAGELRGAVSGGVAQQRDAATAELRQGAQAAPDPGRVPESPATPLEAVDPGPAPASPGAARAVPPPRPEEHVSLEGSKTEVDGEMAANDIDDAQLQRANDPRFSAVAGARAEVHAHAEAAPQQYRQDEGAARARAAQGNAAAETGALTGMQGTREGQQQQVRTRQDEARARDEAARQAVADRIEQIFGETQRAVDGKLAALDAEVNTLFDQGEARARTAMEAHVETRKEAYKDERYSGLDGAAAWTYDLFAGLPDEVNVFYTEARDQYLRDMDAVLVAVSDRVELRLREARNEVTLGKERIRTYVEGLPATLRDTGTRAQAAVQARFDELEQSVDQHREQLASSLAQRYNDARQKADEKLAEMRQSDRGLVARFRDALAEVVRILREFRERISAMLAEASDAIGLIVKDPIGFLGNLIDAVRLGVSQFSDRIGAHLREGLFAWLFGALANAGIQMPRDFSLSSIFGLVLEVLGITAANLRRKVAGVIGERNLGMIERVWGVVQTLISGGLGGLWEQAQEFVGNIGDFIREAVEEWVITRIVRAAITRLVSMFNPAGAIIAAIQGIISTVQFFIERINQIMDLVQAIVRSVARIARGDIAGAADWIEQAMARAIPVMIGFLANLLGLGGISERIRGIIQRLQTRVDRAIDRVIGKIVAGVGRLFGRGRERATAAQPAPGREDRTDGQKEQDLTRAITEVERLQSQPDMTPQRLRADFPRIQRTFGLTSIRLVQDAASRFHVDLTINPAGRTREKEYRATWSRAPGTTVEHENFPPILAATANRPATTIHLLGSHGPDVPNQVLIGRLEALRATYQRRRAEKSAALRLEVGQLSQSLSRAYAQNNTGAQERTADRLLDAQRRLAIHEGARHRDPESMRAALAEWDTPLSEIPPLATRFRSMDIMEQSIRETLSAPHNARKIDEAFTANGDPKPRGTKVQVRGRFYQDIGVGYELRPDHTAVPIRQPLRNIVIFVRIWSPNDRHYVIETAYPERG